MLGIKRQQRKNDGESENVNRNDQKNRKKWRILQKLRC
jgi:hypothetical protein